VVEYFPQNKTHTVEFVVKFFSHSQSSNNHPSRHIHLWDLFTILWQTIPLCTLTNGDFPFAILLEISFFVCLSTVVYFFPRVFFPVLYSTSNGENSSFVSPLLTTSAIDRYGQIPLFPLLSVFCPIKLSCAINSLLPPLL